MRSEKGKQCFWPQLSSLLSWTQCQILFPKQHLILHSLRWVKGVVQTSVHSRYIFWGTPNPVTVLTKLIKVWAAVYVSITIQSHKRYGSLLSNLGTSFGPMKSFSVQNDDVIILTAANAAVRLKQLLLEWGKKQVCHLLGNRALLMPFSL